MVAYPATKNEFCIVTVKQLKLYIYIVEMSMNDSDIKIGTAIQRSSFILMNINKEKGNENKL